MLNSLRNDARLISYLAATVTATTTTLGESGLEVFLGGESTYEVSCVLANSANGDGMKFKLLYSGTTETNKFSEIHGQSPGGNSFSLGDTLTDTQVDQVWHILGVIRTKSPGRLYLQFAKNTDVSDDTPLLVGSYIAAKRY